MMVSDVAFDLQSKIMNADIDLGEGHDGWIRGVPEELYGPDVAAKILKGCDVARAENEEFAYKVGNESGARVAKFYERVGHIIIFEDMSRRLSRDEIQLPFAEQDLMAERIHPRLRSLDYETVKKEMYALGRSQAIFQLYGGFFLNDSEAHVRIDKEGGESTGNFYMYFLDFSHIVRVGEHLDFLPEMVSTMSYANPPRIGRQIQDYINATTHRPSHRRISSVTPFINIYSQGKENIRIVLQSEFIRGYTSIAPKWGQMLAEKANI